MPKVLHRELRFKIIDRCLRDTRRRHTIATLTDACNRTLWDCYGIRVSRRTLQYDISILRRPPYNIELDADLLRLGYYRYADSNCEVPFLDASPVPSSQPVIVTIRTTQQYLSQIEDAIFALSPQAELLTPEPLRQHLLARLKDACAIYQ